MALGIGLVIPNYGSMARDCLTRLPTYIDDWGYDSAWVTDHVVGSREDADRYGLTWADALASLAYLAGVTDGIGLGVSVLVAGYRPAIQTAKMLATIDQLSGGRLIVGVGAGYARAEFAALGLADAFTRRGRLTDDTLRTFRRCWRGGGIHESGAEGAEQFYFAPAPVRREQLPVWVGGSSAASMRRAAEFGQAWHPSGIPPCRLRELGEQLDAMAGRRVARTVRLTLSGNAPSVLALLEAYAQAGCSRLVIDFGARSYDEAWAKAEKFAVEVLSRASSIETVQPDGESTRPVANLEHQELT
jgi:probable F420-dependent oxidoreductase